jgi:hypothetical protein
VAKREISAMETGASNFYVEQTKCAMCNEPALRIGIPEVDVMRGKEPVVCGFCLVEMPKYAAEQTRRDAEGEAFRQL